MTRTAYLLSELLEKSDEEFDAVAQILEPEIFVRGVPVVVVVRDWKNYDRRFARLFKEVDRRTIAARLLVSSDGRGWHSNFSVCKQRERKVGRTKHVAP